jgi:hypothetical protein
MGLEAGQGQEVHKELMGNPEVCVCVGGWVGSRRGIPRGGWAVRGREAVSVSRQERIVCAVAEDSG